MNFPRQIFPFVLLLLLNFLADSDVIFAVAFQFQKPHLIASRSRTTIPKWSHGCCSISISMTSGTALSLSQRENDGDDVSESESESESEGQSPPPQNYNDDDHDDETNDDSEDNDDDEINEREQRDAERDAELFLLEYSIDSFLRGDYDRTFAEDAASPLPGLSPFDTVDAALRSLRDLDKPEPSHGAAVFLRFCVELGRGERWGTTTTSKSKSSWKELLRGSLTPTMLARRLRASEDFSGLLDWTGLDITEDGNDNNDGNADGDGNDGRVGVETTTTVIPNSNVACVDVALSFREGENTSSPETYRFELAKMLGGVWLIDSVQRRSSTPQQRIRHRQQQRRDKGKIGDGDGGKSNNNINKQRKTK